MNFLSLFKSKRTNPKNKYKKTQKYRTKPSYKKIRGGCGCGIFGGSRRSMRAYQH